jgi:Protein of unknown function (DUF3109)
MIIIDDILVSDEVVEEQFVCNLAKCKGACCEEGDAGAPLENWEKEEVEKYYSLVEKYMTPAGINEIKKQGLFTYDEEFGWVTPLVNNGICAYGKKDDKGIILCAFEQAYNNGEIGWKKPLSCHLFPIKTSISKEDENLQYVNYEPREDLCKAACHLGKQLKVPAYIFLKDALIRKYGEEFYDALHACALQLKKNGPQ